MNQTDYYTINRSEINNKLLIDEMNRVNEDATKRKEFVIRNKFQ